MYKTSHDNTSFNVALIFKAKYHFLSDAKGDFFNIQSTSWWEQRFLGDAWNYGGSPKWQSIRQQFAWRLCVQNNSYVEYRGSREWLVS